MTTELTFRLRGNTKKGIDERVKRISTKLTLDGKQLTIRQEVNECMQAMLESTTRFVMRRIGDSIRADVEAGKRTKDQSVDAGYIKDRILVWFRGNPTISSAFHEYDPNEVNHFDQDGKLTWFTNDLDNRNNIRAYMQESVGSGVVLGLESYSVIEHLWVVLLCGFVTHATSTKKKKGEKEQTKPTITDKNIPHGVRTLLHQSLFQKYSDTEITRELQAEVVQKVEEVLLTCEAGKQRNQTTQKNHYDDEDSDDDEPVQKPAKAAPAKTAPKKAALSKATPAKATPAKATPAKATPAKATPKKAAPKKAPPAKTAPKKAAPKKAPAKKSKKPVETEDSPDSTDSDSYSESQTSDSD